MKDKYQNNLLKKVVIGLLTLILIIGAVCIADVTGSHTLAADSVEDATPEGVDYLVEKHTNISDYRVKDALTAPKLSLSGVNGGWLFAGWYTDSNCTSALQSTVVCETTAPMSDGTYYAKYVPADLLTVKCQVSSNTTEDSESTVLRCVSSVDTLKYKKIGFDLITPNGTENMESRTVGTRIKATTEEDAYSYSPKVVDTESEYFFSATYKVVKSETEKFDTRYFVQPYWITKDGTKVYGAGRYVTVNEGMATSTIHLPVKLDVTPTETATFTSDDATAVELISYDENTGYAHFALTVADRTKLKSVTKFEIKDNAGNAVGAAFYRNVLTSFSGSGTDDMSWYDCYKTEDEFVIATSADLYGLISVVNGNIQNFLGKEVYVVSDIVVNKGTAEETGWNKNKADGEVITDGTSFSWYPINNFAGTFDGQGHTISGIYYTTTAKYGGFFKSTTKDAVVENLRLENSYFEHTNANEQAWLGSIAGYALGTFRTIYSDAIVVSKGTFCGGLLGVAPDDLTILNCWFNGKVNQTANSGVGGILGYAEAGKTIIQQCLNTGTIAGLYQVGGICASIGGSGTTVTIQDSLNTGKITGTSQYGAIFTQVNSDNTTVDISNVYCTLESCANTNWKTKGTLVGAPAQYYETYLKGIVNQNDIKLDFTNYWAMRATDVPVLRSFADLAEGYIMDTSWYDAEAEEMTIDSLADLYGFNYIANNKSETFNGKTVKLEADIVMNNAGTDTNKWTPIALFEGTFDGQGHTISGVTISGAGKQGFFNQALDCTIKNFSLTRTTVTSSSFLCGSIAAQFTGIMENVYSDADVTLTQGTTGLVGGLVGAIQPVSTPSSTAPSKSIISNCWYAGDINTTGRYTGGIVAGVNQTSYTELTINNCLVTGTMDCSYTSFNSMGGFCGCIGNSGNKLTVKDSLFAGAIKTKTTASNGWTIGEALGEASSADSVIFTNVYSIYVGYTEYVHETSITGTVELPDDVASLQGETVKNSTKLDFSTPVWVTREGDFPILKIFEK